MPDTFASQNNATLPSDRFRTDYEVLSRNADPNGLLSLRAIVTMLFDAADRHAAQWEVSLGQLSTTDQTWVLSRMHVRLDEHPRWDERLAVETWPTGAMRVLAGRDFGVYRGADEIGRATTLWLMLDRVTRKPVPLPEFVKEFELPEGSPVVKTRGSWPAPHGNVESSRHTVRWNDLDLNRHAGALSYLDWLTGPLPINSVDGNHLRELDILFKGEAFAGDELQIEVGSMVAEASDMSAFSHVARRDSDGAILATARTVWAS